MTESFLFFDAQEWQLHASKGGLFERIGASSTADFDVEIVSIPHVQPEKTLRIAVPQDRFKDYLQTAMRNGFRPASLAERKLFAQIFNT